MFIKILLSLVFISPVFLTSCKTEKPMVITHSNKATPKVSVTFIDKSKIEFKNQTNPLLKFELTIVLSSLDGKKEEIFKQDLKESTFIEFKLPENYEDFEYINALVVNVNKSYLPVSVVSNYKIGEQEEIEAAKKTSRKSK